jgi:ribosomal protein S18 acetylase RimI-like enzyme
LTVDRGPVGRRHLPEEGRCIVDSVAGSPGPETVRIRRITDVELDQVTEVMTRAFDDDPVVNHLAKQDERREERIRHFMRLALVPLTHPYGETYTTADLEGAAYWNPPGQRPHGIWNDLRLMPKLVRVTGVAGLPRAASSFGLMEQKHPGEPHYYLFALGVDPSRQGKGIGSKLMAPVLERCDHDGVPAYLESTNERNLPLYERHAFRVVEEVPLPKGGPTMWRMWRDPQ